LKANVKALLRFLFAVQCCSDACTPPQRAPWTTATRAVSRLSYLMHPPALFAVVLSFPMLYCSAWTLHGSPGCHDTSPTCFLHLGRVPAWSGPPPLGRSLAEGYHLQEDGPADGAGSPLLPRIPLPASLQPTPLPPPSSVPMPESIFAALGKPLNVDGAQCRMGAHLCLVCLLTSMHMHRLDHPPQHRGDEALDHAKRHGTMPSLSFWPFNTQDARATRLILTNWRGKTGSPACQGLQVGQALCRPVLVKTMSVASCCFDAGGVECPAAAELGSGWGRPRGRRGVSIEGRGCTKRRSGAVRKLVEGRELRWVTVHGGVPVVADEQIEAKHIPLAAARLSAVAAHEAPGRGSRPGVSLPGRRVRRSRYVRGEKHVIILI